ncbi:GntR family transcriptional regulator [Curtobacterium sp. MCLR17_007]|uniref:GntR family transcriptional regulator n=1 Tax=Curtobacterium sp. MCLR17_007 TaxID=2175648 RepID=UPI0015E8C6C7|nr:GntR family transcriptional regulator [Curtobacterium sp. MCLR17_007]WIB59500.1 GntR family transcriptional regulator [Curtobacterium sp. MCLR17_007]
MGFGETTASAVLGQRERDGLGVPRSLLRDAVFLRLLERILRGEYRRGQRLRLEALADDMRVSRTPVREALVPLEALRLVSVQRYVGVVIAPWSVEQMQERIRLGCCMLAEPPATTGATDEHFDPAWIRDCLSEAGAFVELAAWLLRRAGSSVSADLLAAQRPVLDVFYTDDVALANGIDADVDRRQRLRLLDRARDAAERDDLVLCGQLVRQLGTCLSALPDRFRSAESA